MSRTAARAPKSKRPISPWNMKPCRDEGAVICPSRSCVSQLASSVGVANLIVAPPTEAAARLLSRLAVRSAFPDWCAHARAQAASSGEATG
eukprot:scaffold26468_cov58-Phaeocystis_antarctica.AAC.4